MLFHWRTLVESISKNHFLARQPGLSSGQIVGRSACLIMIGLLGLPISRAGAATNVTVEFREPLAAAYEIEASVLTNAGVRAALASLPEESWTEGRIGGTTNLVEFSSRVALQLDPGQTLEIFLAGGKLALSRTVSSNLFILQAPDSATAIREAARLAKEEGVSASYPVMRRALKRHNAYSKAPNDPLFAQQWHLENRDSDFNLAGPDLNIRAAWPSGRGSNVLVAVADDGFQLDHPELLDRANGAPHYNFYRSRTNGAPASADANHATAVAGLIAAEAGNKRGVAGVAPEARLASWVIFGSSSRGSGSIATDEQLMNMFQYVSNRVSVQNHSWGSASTTQLPLDALSTTGIENAVKKGRGGKGVVIVRAAGNSRETLTDANDDGYANDPRIIAVAAVRKDGRATSYSSPGACLLVGAPSGDLIDTNGDGQGDAADPTAPDVLTTDRTGGAGYNTDSSDAGDYAYFNGTSASSPQVAGVAALILGANPDLTYRDVQQVLILSARHYDLTDPNVRLNGAGFRISHNVGFGIPDAGFAVDLAKRWSPRPPAETFAITNSTRQNIPDDALRVICSEAGIPAALSSIHCLPGLGPHPDDPTPALPIIYAGTANQELTADLHGKAALIQRGGSFFSDKIARAARAGAAFAIIFNDQGTTEIQAMGGTTFVPIPAVSIGRTAGEALRDFVAAHPETTAKLQITSAVYHFTVGASLVCEQVGLRLKTTHSLRSDVRVTLLSPMGTRSVLQAINTDNTAGPKDWTYWTTQHFYESSFGDWRLEVSDERNSTVRTFPSGTAPATGAVTYAELILKGVAITDSDHDGLDDAWEMKWFGNLDSGPRDDPDHDGSNNAREQILGTDPTVPDAAFKVDLTELSPGHWRFSWPGRENESYKFQSSASLGLPFHDLATVPGRFPVTEYVVPAPGQATQFYRVKGESGL